MTTQPDRHNLGHAFEVKWEDLDGTRIIVAAGEIDLTARPTLTEAFDARNLSVDFSGVTFIDSTGLTCLIAAKGASDTFILNPSKPVRRVIEIAGLSEHFS